MRTKKEKVIVFIKMNSAEGGESISKYIRELFTKDGRYNVVTLIFNITEDNIENHYDFKYMLLSDYIDKNKSE